MSVVLRDGAGAHTSNTVRLKSAADGCAFLSARDDSFDIDGRKQRKSQHASRSKDLKSATPHVAVVLGYFDGQDYVCDQLRSILDQSHSAVHIYLCDDKSEPRFSFDGLRLDSDQLSQISIGRRPRNVGFTNNFLNALASISDDFEYFAFSDQDDIWHQDKLERALVALAKAPAEKPALYCARTEIADATCEHTLGYSPRFNKTPSFANALVQNIGGGNTMVFNRAARDFIINAAVDTNVVSHDWWCYQIVSGAGGYVVYDPEPCLKYRQHANNLVGANTSWRARFLRIHGLLQGRFRTWNDINLKALSEHSHLLAADNRKILSNFIEARQSSLIKRLFLFKWSGIYRQTLFGNLGLLLGIILNKV
jgi:glycosyltransferase involved in cell wall biosynthesis